MSIIIPANSAVGGAFEVANSVRMNRGSSDYFRRTNNTAGTSDKIGTYSGWVKRSTTTLDGMFFEGKDLAANNYTQIYFQATGALTIYGSGGGMDLVTTALFRDPSAWYHVVVAFDTTQGTATNRVKVYVNGVQQTSFSTGTYLAQNATIYFGINGDQQGIGVREDGALLWNGYMSEIVYVDGQALAPTSFGEFDEDSGIWKPINVSGLTFGNNGCYLDFEDSSNLGNVVAGNSTDFTENGLTSIDQSTDTCTNNFATLNPLALGPDRQALSDGNLTGTSSDWDSSVSTIAVTTGKWFAEMKCVSGTGNGMIAGVIDASDLVLVTGATSGIGFTTNSVGYINNGSKFIADSSSSYGASFADNNIIGIALDMTSATKTVTFYKDGVSQGAISLPTAGTLTFFLGCSTSNGTTSMNFGNPPYAISSGNADANGYGNFEFAVPSGYFSLNTKNLAEHG